MFVYQELKSRQSKVEIKKGERALLGGPEDEFMEIKWCIESTSQAAQLILPMLVDLLFKSSSAYCDLFQIGVTQLLQQQQVRTQELCNSVGRPTNDDDATRCYGFANSYQQYKFDVHIFCNPCTSSINLNTAGGKFDQVS